MTTSIHSSLAHFHFWYFHFESLDVLEGHMPPASCFLVSNSRDILNFWMLKQLWLFHWSSSVVFCFRTLRTFSAFGCFNNSGFFTGLISPVANQSMYFLSDLSNGIFCFHRRCSKLITYNSVIIGKESMH